MIHKWEMKNLTDIQEWMEQKRVARLEELSASISAKNELLKLKAECESTGLTFPSQGEEGIEEGNKDERKLSEFSKLSGEEFFFPDPKLKRRKVIVVAEQGLVGWHFMGTLILEGETIIITSTGQRFEKAR